MKLYIYGRELAGKLKACHWCRRALSAADPVYIAAFTDGTPTKYLVCAACQRKYGVPPPEAA